MKKGFTLVEILSVITILGVLMVLIIPSVIKTTDSSKQKAYDLVIMTFEAAAQEYVSDNRSKIEELRVIGTYYDITLQTLGDGGYIELPVVNPKTNENFDPLTTIISVAKQADGTFAYKVGEGNSLNYPILTLVGNNNVTINCSATGNYNDPGATVIDAYDPTAGPVYGPSLPLSNAGTHTLKYSYTNQNNKKTNQKRVVTIKSVEPIITVVGGTAPRIIEIGSPFVAPSATASDACEGGTLNVTVTSTVVPTIAGSYTVTYAATNIAGISASKVVIVKVLPPASAPDIASNMIPIYYDAIDSKWKKADVTNLNNTYKWYDYTSKKWANAVTVTNGTRSTYQNAALGTPILETDILTYMVWIPKYKYRIPDREYGVPRTIDIVFEGSTATKSTGDAVATYRTHPAFTFGTTELNGIWMGKYELTGTIGGITTKPGITPLVGQSVSPYFTAIRNMENSSNPYGYVANEVDTHMIKNSEWGAALYLSHSIYGKNAEITQQNSGWSNITGNPGPEASTTGNIYGIYDMSGGALEYVMGNYNNTPAYSEIIFPIGSEYYNLYTDEWEYTACNGEICYGEALEETEYWYNDYNNFVDTSDPWFIRGGYFGGGEGNTGGMFIYDGYGGYGGDYISSRACQTKQ